MPERLRDINLLPKYERESSSLFYLFIALLLITLLSYVMISFYYFTTKSKLANAELEYAELNEKVELLQTQLNELETEEGNLDRAVAFVENYNIPTSILIDELVELLPDHSYLKEYRYQTREVNLETHFELLDDTALYTTNLLTSNYIRDTKVDYIKTFTLKDEGGQFSKIPRYEAKFDLVIDTHSLKGADREDE